MSLNSASLKPLVVAAALPSLIPEVMNGLASSNGIPFLLQVKPTFSRNSSASFPVILCFLRSTSKRWVSVPPVTILYPLFNKPSANVLALLLKKN